MSRHRALKGKLFLSLLLQLPFTWSAISSEVVSPFTCGESPTPFSTTQLCTTTVLTSLPWVAPFDLLPCNYRDCTTNSHPSPSAAVITPPEPINCKSLSLGKLVAWLWALKAVWETQKSFSIRTESEPPCSPQQTNHLLVNSVSRNCQAAATFV